MLASYPASILNHILRKKGILIRFNLEHKDSRAESLAKAMATAMPKAGIFIFSLRGVFCGLMSPTTKGGHIIKNPGAGAHYNSGGR